MERGGGSVLFGVYATGDRGALAGGEVVWAGLSVVSRVGAGRVCGDRL